MLDHEFHFQLLRTFQLSNRRIVQQVLEQGMFPGQPKILEYLMENDGCIARDICRGCVLDKSTMTSLLSRMEQQGLIRRSAVTEDKRTARIYMTEKGKAAALKIKEICCGVDEKAFRGIAEEDRKYFMEMLKTISANLEGDEK